MIKIIKNVKKKIQLLLALETAAVAIIFGLTVPVIVSAVGVSVDLSQAYLVRERLSRALDASALAAAAMATDDQGELEDKVMDFMEANYPPYKIGFTYDVTVDQDGNELTVAAYARLETAFMSVVGIPYVNVYAQTVVQREVRGLEVVMVLDNTGSMGPSNMVALRTAAENFVTILFDRASDPEDIKIGMVPYSTAVNVGRYGLGQFPDGSAGYGDAFVSLPPGMSFTNNHGTSSDWYGCVVEHHDTNYNDNAKHVTNSKGQLWSTGTGSNQNKCASASTCRGHGWNPARTDNDPYPDDVEDEYEGPWDIYAYGRIISQGDKCSNYSSYSNSRCSSCAGYNSTCNQAYCFCWNSTPNIYCPWARVVPLTSDEEELLTAIPTMQHEGATLSNVGMAWGYRVLSPEPPFEEGAAWDSKNWDKAIVMMTDGEMSINNAHLTAYQDANKYDDSITNALLEGRLLEVCTMAKNNGVLIYTVTFDHATANISAATKAIYKNCASDASKYYDAPSQSELIEVFERISRELSNLHIKQ